MTDSQTKTAASAPPWMRPTVIVILLLIALLVFAMPFVLSSNPVAQVFSGIVLTILSVLASVVTTHFYSRRQQQDELTRYGIQAWRNLDALSIKLSQHLGDDEWESDTLRDWLLDVDGAKWAWRDLLREVFELQARLEEAKEEIATKYRQQMDQADSPAARLELASEQTRALRQLAAKAPLPMSLPEEIPCPRCGEIVAGDLGTAGGQTAGLECSSCHARFHIHRQSDGGVRVGSIQRWDVFYEQCPSCGEDIKLSVPEGRSVQFATKCHACGCHLQFTGTGAEHQLANLGRDNVTFECPACQESVSAWITPRGGACFKSPCPECNALLELSGSPDDFNVRVA